MKSCTLSVIAALAWSLSVVSHAEVKNTVARNDNEKAKATFTFSGVPAPSKNDAATKAKFVIVDGSRDQNGGDVDTLHDGRVPGQSDEPSQSFFFNAGSDGGRLLADLGAPVEIKQVNTYSWHPGTRAAQVYTLYASDGAAGGFKAEPKRGTDPLSCGWKLVGKVDTRGDANSTGGQYGVTLSDPAGTIGKYRYLLFDISPTEKSDPFGNTFFNEIDVIDRDGSSAVEPATSPPAPPINAQTEDGKYQFTFDVALAPDLSDWVSKDLVPVVRDWYPKIVALLPSDGFEAPTKVTISLREGMRGTPAAAGGNRISCNIDWFRRNLQGEAKGAVVHELVHVVQQYGRARRDNPDATRTPGWVVEGIADYIRWFLYEPQSKGAEITERNLARARYDANYRISANFLNWVTGKYDKEIVKKLNTAAREGRYKEELWKECTGKTVEELGDEWKKGYEAKFAPRP
jgi:hypothetical protein